MPWHDWEPKTIQQDPNYSGELMLPCPHCNRPVHADMLIDITSLPDSLRDRWAVRADYACDACRSTLVREGLVSQGDLMRLTGAPEDVAAVIDEKNAADAGQFAQSQEGQAVLRSLPSGGIFLDIGGTPDATTSADKVLDA